MSELTTEIKDRLTEALPSWNFWVEDAGSDLVITGDNGISPSQPGSRYMYPIQIPKSVMKGKEEVFTESLASQVKRAIDEA